METFLLGMYLIVDHALSSQSVRYATSDLTVRDSHPAMTMTNGSPCPNFNGMHAATTVHFKCDTSVFGAGAHDLL